MKKILFLGDSITDGARSREDDSYLGVCYPASVSAQLDPDEYTVLNRGLSGNTVIDLYARIKRDAINLAPDVITILIGVNDILHEVADNDGVSADRFELIYNCMLEDIKAALPNAKIIIMSPFVLLCPGTADCELYPNRWERLFTSVRTNAEISKRIADKFSCDFIDLQELFDVASETKENMLLLYDGIHPTELGHEMISDVWLSKFKNI